MNKSLRPAATYEPVRKHQVSPSIPGWLNYYIKAIARTTICTQQDSIMFLTINPLAPGTCSKNLKWCDIQTCFSDWYLQQFLSLQWRHNGHDGVSHHQPQDCLLNRLFRRDQRKHQSCASLAFVGGIHQWPVNSPHRWPVTRKMIPFDDVIIWNFPQVHPTGAQWW